MKPTLSVIIPNYNNAPWLPRCLDSVLNQTFRDLEILLVDDGSSDDSEAVIRAYAQKDSRVRPVFQENGGVTAARLAGLALAEGEWITFVDSDDVIEPDMYQRLLDSAAACGADISHCGQKMVYPDGRIVYYYNTGDRWEQDNLTGLRELLEEKKIEPGLCNKVYRRTLFEGLPEQMDRSIKNNEDFLMNYYLFSKANKSVFEDFCPYQYLIREGSASQRKLNEHLIYDPIRVKQIILERCRPELEEDVRRAMAATSLFAYAQLCRGMDQAYEQDRRNVRGIIRQQRKFSRMLPLKNMLMVWIISYTPWVFHGVYGFYYRYIKKM